MSSVEFEETRIESRLKYDETPKMVGLVIKYSGGLIKNEKQANYLLIVLVIFLLMIPFFTFFGENPNSAAIYPVLPAEY